MEHSEPSSSGSNDIFSLSDQVLSERLEFIEEIGFGNWGSVWLCRPKPATAKDGSVRPLGQKIAVKLVHRSKTSTTAARVRSLWNEMKIVKSLKSDREPTHPSIIPFHSFIITPSYALITMSYLPTLVPVEVEESKAREWFKFLLSGVEFLHQRGVVHNDIKPANILLSHKNIPVLVDYGFAEKYDKSSDTAFHSNLSYGTPEYLSPERARGLPHDTRKSDVWSLGVTFFEILVGRTPFEKSDGEQFSTNEDLEKYWERTLRGKWVGSWKFSKGMEKLLQRMISPNADLRCTATQAKVDSYWQAAKKDPVHRRASSCASTSSSLEKDFEKLLSGSPSSWKHTIGDRANATVDFIPPSNETADRSDVFLDSPDGKPHPLLAKSKSQPKVNASSKLAQPRKRPHVAAPFANLSPIKASPNPSPAASPFFSHAAANTSTMSASAAASAKAKENISAFNKLAASVNGGQNVRRPFGALNANANQSNSLGRSAGTGKERPTSVLVKKPSGHSHGAKAVKLLGDLDSGNDNGTGATRNASFANLSASLRERGSGVFSASFSNVDVSGVVNASFTSNTEKSRESTNVKDRVREWEREKERLREMERLEELERERDELHKKEKRERKKRREEREARKTKKDEEENGVQAEEVAVELNDEPKVQHPAAEEEPKEGSIAVRRRASNLHINLPQPEPSSTGASRRVALGGLASASNVNSNILGSRKQSNGVDDKKTSTKEWDWDKENMLSSATSPVLPMFNVGPRLTQVFNISMDTPPPPSSANRVPKSRRGSFKHSIKASIDKTIEFCKAASLAQVGSGRTTPARGLSFDLARPNTAAGQSSTVNSATSKSRASGKDGKEAWEFEPSGDGSLPEISPLPIVKNAAQNEKVAADSRMDRMAIWMHNVEKVVEDAKLNFASSTSAKDLPLPPLPPPLARATSQNRTSRLPRRVLAASQIFHSDENGNISPMADQSMLSPNNSMFITAADISKGSLGPSSQESGARSPDMSCMASPRPSVAATPARVSEDVRRALPIPEIHTPSKRRATVSICSPGPAERPFMTPAAHESPRKDKSKSLQNLLDMHIAPISLLEAELNKVPEPEPTPRLSEVIDRNLFIAPHSSRDDLLNTSDLVEVREPSYDELHASPCHVEPYPQRMRNTDNNPVLDTPSRHRIEGVYDRFLMATSGVKRLGKGYQSDNIGSIGSSTGLGMQPKKVFHTTRRPMPPPVSSEDARRAASMDELGMIPTDHLRSDSPGANNKEGLMKKAMKLMVPKATSTSRRLSKIY